jgi:O-antigen ligase
MLEETEGGSRIEHWIVAMQKIAERPFLGNGIAGYFGYFKEQIGHEIAMHNTFIAVLFEVGAVGLSAFLALFLIPFRRALKNRHGMIIAVVLSNMIAAFFLDALHQRYLWNAMMFGLMYYNALSFDPREQDIINAKEQEKNDSRKVKTSSKRPA